MFKSKYYVLKIIEIAGNKVSGRKRLQKLSYLMQRIGFPNQFDFIYHRFGPYSAELSSTMSDLSALGLVKETNEKKVFEYKITKEGKTFIKLLEKNKLVEKYITPNEIEKAANFISKQDPSLLELVSTIIFLMEYGKSNKNACKEAGKLKPHLADRLDDAQKILQNLPHLAGQ